MSECERAEGPLAQFCTRSVQNSRTLLIRTGLFFLKWLYLFGCVCVFFCVTYIPTPITQEPDIVESFGLQHFVAPIHAEYELFSDFEKCVRGRAEGRKTVCTKTSITREQFDIESSTLRHFVAWSNLNRESYVNLTYCRRVRAEGPLFSSVTIKYQRL